MRTRVDTRCVDVEVLGEVAHFDRFRNQKFGSMLCNQLVYRKDMFPAEEYLRKSVTVCSARRQQDKVLVESEYEK